MLDVKHAVAVLLTISSLGLARTHFAKVQAGDRPITLNSGDAAPPISFSAWIKGDPVPRFQKGTIYVLDFWATWCHPCILVMPHMSDIAKRYKGRVQVIGVDVRETIEPSRALNEKVRAFVEKQSNHMDYSACIDDAKKSMLTNYMTASGEHLIPCAYIVDQNGNIADIIQGFNKLKDPRIGNAITKLLAGTFDYKAAAKHHRLEVTEGRLIFDP